jgi:hypothetical protein
MHAVEMRGHDTYPPGKFSDERKARSRKYDNGKVPLPSVTGI